MSELDNKEEAYLDQSGIQQEEKEAEQKKEKKIDEDLLASLEGKDVWRVKVMHSNATEYCIYEGDEKISLDRDDFVIIPTRYGRDLGRVLGRITHLIEIGDDPVEKIVRKANAEDLKNYEEYKEKDQKAYRLCREKIQEHQLEMKLVSAHYLLDEPKILFFFTADSRVDFRELVKDLVSIFKTRIELRQIGVRDESRVLGGMGMCGRGYCCHTLTDKLNPVSIKMAKEQNLSLNSLKISGACGRLLCCLAYEYPFYKEQKSKLPRIGDKIRFEGKEYNVNEINIFKQEIQLYESPDNQPLVDFSEFYYYKPRKEWRMRSLSVKQDE
ncbi:MAG: hypothetical protein JXR70_05095 [Spirochaetales bacterium]|nr:hypothetical protein [Spirochaetales bacterium]